MALIVLADPATSDAPPAPTVIVKALSVMVTPLLCCALPPPPPPPPSPRPPAPPPTAIRSPVVVPDGGVQVVAPTLVKFKTHLEPEITGVTPSTEPKVPAPTIAELGDE